MIIRSVALLMGVVVLAGASTVRADQGVFRPSVHALAAAGSPDQPRPDEPPPREDPLTVKKKAEPVAPEEEAPVYKKWWFWALTAVVVGGTIAFGVASHEPVEHHPRACPPGVVACFGDGRTP